MLKQGGHNINKTLWERIFGHSRTTSMILWTCLIAAKQLSFAEPHSLNGMSQSTTKIVSFHDNVWNYAHLQCRHAWSQIATILDISGYSPERKVYLSSTDTDTLRKIDWHMCFHTYHIVQCIPVRLLTRANKVPQVQYPQGLIRE